MYMHMLTYVLTVFFGHIFTGKATKTLKASVHGLIGSLPVPFHIPIDNGCISGVPCPVKVGDVDHYKSFIPVLTSYPSVIIILLINNSIGGDIVIWFFMRK